MGLFSYRTPGQSRLERNLSRYTAPDFSPGTNYGQYQPRGFPERVQADIIGEGGQHLANLATLPAQVFEQPLSWLSAATETPEGSNLVDDITTSIRNIPFIGEHLSNAGGLATNAVMNSMNTVPTLHNGLHARFLQETASLSDDSPLDPKYDLLVGNPFGHTVGEYRRYLRNSLGWDVDTMTQQLVSGEKGWLDFGETKFTEDPTADFALRMAFDPLNLVLGTGVILKGAKGAATLLRLQNNALRATKVLDGTRKLGVRQGVAALMRGSYEGVTKHSLSKFVEGFVAGSGPVFRGYRNVSLGMYGVNHGVNIAAEVVPQDWIDDGFGKTLVDYFKRVEESRPLSTNALFSLWSVFHFPVRGEGGILTDVYRTARKGRVKTMRLDHELRFAKELGQTRDQLVSRLGQDSYDAFMYQTLRVAIIRKAWRQGVTAIPRALEVFDGSSLSQLGHHLGNLNGFMTRLIKRTMDEGSISGDDFVDAMHHMFSNRGDVVTDVAGGVQRQGWDPERFLRDWETYEAIGRNLSDTYQNGNVLVPALNDEIVTTSQIDWIDALLQAEAVEGRISARAANEILMNAPALFRMDQGGLFTRTLTRSAKDVEVKELHELLLTIRKENAWEPREWLAQSEVYEASAERSLARANRSMDENGKLLDDVNPDYGNARIVLPTAQFARGTHTLRAPIDTLEQLQTLRATPGVRANEFNIPQALAESGYGLQSAAPVGFIQGEVMQTGMVLRAADGTDFQTLAEVAAHALPETGADKASIILTGDAIAAHGVPANAIDFRWEPGRLDPERADKLVRVLRTRFGDNVMINDTTGTVRVLVREGTRQAERVQKNIAAVNKVIGLEPSQQPAFVQDIVKKAKKTDAPGTRTAKSVSDLASRSHRWHLAKSNLDARRGKLPRVAGEAESVGDGPVRGAAEEVVSGSVGPDIPTERQPTRYERRVGRGPGQSTGEHRVDVGGAGEYQGRVRDATTGAARGRAPVVPGDAERFITADGHSGVYVGASGRATFWHKSRAPWGDDWDDVLAESSNVATWTVVPDIRGTRGRSLINQLGDHGWRPVARTADDQIYLVRDPSGIVPNAVEIPPFVGGDSGWALVKDQVPVWSEQQARVHVRAMRSMYLGDLRPNPEVSAAGAMRGTGPLTGREGAIQRTMDAGDVAESQRLNLEAEARGQAANTSEEFARLRDEMRFKDAAQAAKTSRGQEGGAGLDIKDDYTGHQMFLSPDGKAGAAVAPDGEMVTVFRAIDGDKAALADVWRQAEEAGATWLNGYEVVAKTYARRGWVPVAKVKFDPQYAEAGATAAQHGDVIFMANPASLKGKPKRVREFADYDEAAAYTKGLVEKRTSQTARVGGEELRMYARTPGEVPGPYDDVTVESDVFAQVSRPERGGPQNYKLHISATPEEAPRVLAVVSGVADRHGVTYKWVKELSELSSPDGFGAGAVQQGKFVTVYPPDDIARAVASEIDSELARSGLGRNALGVPGEIRFGDDSAVYYRREGNANRHAAGGGVDANNPIGHREPRATVGGEELRVNPPEKTIDPDQNAAALRMFNRVSEIDAEMTRLASTLKRPNNSKRYRALQKERTEIEAGVRNEEFGLQPIEQLRPGYVRKDGTVVGDHPGREYTTVNDAQVVEDPRALSWLWDADEELAQFKPNFDPSISENLDPAELAKVYALQAKLKIENPGYTLKLAPQHATPFFSGQGDAYRAIVAGRQMARDDFRYGVSSKFARAKDLMFAPVYSRDLVAATRQETYDQLLNAGATAGEVNQFIRALQQQWDSTRIPKVGVHVFRGYDQLLSGTIDDIAHGKMKVAGFQGFDQKVLKELARRGDTPHDIIRRSGSRTYRSLAKRFPAQDGQKSLGNVIDALYGKERFGPQKAFGVGRGGAWGVKTAYHLMRFLLDPRWYLMNMFEADILGLGRAGLTATRMGGALKRDPVSSKFLKESPATALHQNRFKGDFVGVEDILSADAQASGWLDTRRLGGYVGATFDVERPQTTIEVLRRVIETGDPAIKDLQHKFGGSTDDWIKGLDDLLYDIDTKGAKATVMDEAARMAERRELVWGSRGEPQYWTDFLDGLYKAHQKNFRDIMHTFHGNVNRSNLERLFNSPLLWWPLSYQLKAGKWVFDLMTERLAGGKTDLLGSWGLDRILSKHYEYYENEPEYRRLWDDHPATWRTISMMLPMTPFDMGVFEARWTRYSQSWIGSQLGLWDEDETYPQDPVNFVMRSMQLGPWFTVDLAQEIFREMEG